MIFNICINNIATRLILLAVSKEDLGCHHFLFP